MIYSVVISQHFCGETEKNMKVLSQVSGPHGPESFTRTS
jgi:hypothetical protein